MKSKNEKKRRVKITASGKEEGVKITASGKEGEKAK